MSMKLVIATHNEDKLKEIQTYLESFSFNAISLNKFPHIGEIIEDGQTLLDNALIKAREVFDKTGLPTISDDTGLEVDALNGKPGVFSARYAGEECTYLDNVKKLLKNMKKIPIPNRTAQFKTVMVFKDKNQELIVEGVVKGLISRELKGDQGFGYDPIFFVPDLGKTFGELSAIEKNKISHRGNALMNLVNSLKEHAPDFYNQRNKEMA